LEETDLDYEMNDLKAQIEEKDKQTKVQQEVIESL
jgi:hypothetical protein